MDTLAKEAKKHMEKQLALAQDYVDTGAIKEIPEIPSKTYGNVTFKDGRVHKDYDKTFIDAITIKRYNGASKPSNDKGNSGHFVEWYENKWVFHELNGYKDPFNYVKRVCDEY
jgi:lipopolysaccharide export LptBFGC system permease protein LptF